MSTGKSFSEAIILASTNPQYDKRIRVSDKHLPVYEIFFLCPVTHVANLKNLLILKSRTTPAVNLKSSKIRTYILEI